MPGTTPNKGFRYPLMTEAGDPNVIAAMTFDMDAAASSDDALRVIALTQRGASITNSTAPSVAKATTVKFTFDTVRYDPAGFSNLGVNNDRFTVTKAGLYLVGLKWEAFPAGFGGLGMTSLELTIAKNTTAAPAVPNYRRRKYPGFTGTASGTVKGTVFHPMVLAAGDFVTAQTFWNGSGAGPIVDTAPVFWIYPLALS